MPVLVVALLLLLFQQALLQAGNLGRSSVASSVGHNNLQVCVSDFGDKFQGETATAAGLYGCRHPATQAHVWENTADQRPQAYSITVHRLENGSVVMSC
jgi:hypothetical protein